MINSIISIIILITNLYFSNEITNDKEQKKINNEWKILFNGYDFEGWHQYNGSKISEKWTVEEGIMIFDPSKGSKKYGGNDIVTNQEFTNFELSLEWKISEKGNSGLFWGVQELENLGTPFLTGPEIQILDNERHPDAKINPKFHQAGSLYDMVQPSEDVCNPADQWNIMILKIDHSKNLGSVTLNGVEIVKFPLAGPKWQDLVKNSKFSDWEYFGSFKTGKIGLQDHGDKVSFRNIKIREL